MRPNRGSGRLFLLVLMVGSLLFAALPTGAQNQDLAVGEGCIARVNGTFSCQVRIPPRTVPGEYNLVAECPRGVNGSAYPPSAVGPGNSTGSLSVSSNQVNPNQVITASGDGCLGNREVFFRLEKIGPLAFSGFLTGVAEAQASGTRILTARISVVAPRTGGGVAAAAGSGAAAGTAAGAKAAPRGTLTRTGIDVLPWLGAGLTAIAAGGALVLMGRRRTRKKSLPV